MHGREVYKFAVTRMQEVLVDYGQFARAGLTHERSAVVIPHQSNLRIIESAVEKLGLPPEKVAVNIDRYGNTSAASIPLAMDEAWRAGKITQGRLGSAGGLWPGLTWGSALIGW